MIQKLKNLWMIKETKTQNAKRTVTSRSGTIVRGTQLTKKVG